MSLCIHIHAEIPGSQIDSIRSSALQALVGGVTGGVLTIVGALVSIILAILKMKGGCNFNPGENNYGEISLRLP